MSFSSWLNLQQLYTIPKRDDIGFVDNIAFGVRILGSVQTPAFEYKLMFVRID